MLLSIIKGNNNASVVTISGSTLHRSGYSRITRWLRLCLCLLGIRESTKFIRKKVINTSWYSDFYICYKSKEDGKFYPFGPFDYKGKLHSVFERSGYDQELAREFWDISSAEKRKELISEELFKTLTRYEDDDESYEEKRKEFYDGKGYWLWSYLPYEDLPVGDYIKKGYVLIDEIEEYENREERGFDGFYGVLSPNVYAKKMENELKFGPPKPTKNEWGEEYTPTSMSEYSYYVWPDYDCIEYAANRIRNALGLMRDWYELKDNKEEIYILCTQG